MENENTGKAEKIFADLGRKIDEIIENTKENREEVTKEFKERLDNLKKSKDKLETEFQEFTSNKDGKWTGVKGHLDQALKEVKGAIDSIFGRSPGDKS